MADLLKTTTAPGSGVLIGSATSAVTGSTATVSVGGVAVTAQVLRGLTLAVGDPVLIARQGSAWYVLGRTAATTPPLPLLGGYGNGAQPSPDVPPAVTTGALVCPPGETRSWRSGWRTDNDDVYQGQYGSYGNHTGCAFYGSTPRSLAGSTVTAATLHVSRLTGGAYATQTTTLRLVAETSRPSGAPTLGSSTTGPALAVGASTSTFAVPAAWAQAMVDGTAGGLAIYTASGSPYVRTAGRGAWAPAWTLVISWSR